MDGFFCFSSFCFLSSFFPYQLVYLDWLQSHRFWSFDQPIQLLFSLCLTQRANNLLSYVRLFFLSDFSFCLSLSSFLVFLLILSWCILIGFRAIVVGVSTNLFSSSSNYVPSPAIFRLRGMCSDRCISPHHLRFGKRHRIWVFWCAYFVVCCCCCFLCFVWV